MTTLPEDQLLWMLRSWKCLNCGWEHSGPPSIATPWRWCPLCRSSSARTYEVVLIEDLKKVESRHQLAELKVEKLANGLRGIVETDQKVTGTTSEDQWDYDGPFATLARETLTACGLKVCTDE